MSAGGEAGEAAEGRSALGSVPLRLEGRLKVTGTAAYAADHALPGMLHAVAVCSRVARGRVLAIDGAAAQARPGVRLVLTPASMPRLQRPDGALATGLGEARLPLSDDQVRYAGQVLAVVVADTLEQAEAGAAAVASRTQAEPPTGTLAQAMASAQAPRAPRTDGEVLSVRRGEPETAFHDAAIKLRRTYRTPVALPQPLEPLVTIAAWQPDGALWLYVPVESAARTRDVVAQVLGLGREQVRVFSPFVGGSFGSRVAVWPHTLLCAVAARQLGRPVRLAVGRTEPSSAGGHRPETTQTLSLGASAAGELRAILHTTLTHTSPLDEYVEPAGSVSGSLYRCEHVAVAHQLVRLDRPAPAALPAAGEAPGLFALESALDELAAELGLDPLRLRQINHADVDATARRPYASKRLRDCYRIGAERIGWQARKAEPRARRSGRWLIGLGMATATALGHAAGSAVRVRIGRATAAGPLVLVRCAASESGGGAYTLLAQAAAEALGVPVAQVTVQLGDSQLEPAPAAAATVAAPVLAAARAAARQLAVLAMRDPQSPLYRRALDEIEVKGGRIYKRDEPGRGEAWSAQLLRSRLEAVEGPGAPEPAPAPVTDEAHGVTRSFGAQFCEIHVDPELGRVRVARHVVVLDLGRVPNPQLARSRATGGVILGIGMALTEQVRYDAATGRAVGDGRYLVPTAADIGEISAHFLDPADPEAAARGVDDLAVCGVAPAIANAIYNATGRRLRELPLTPDKLLL
ncbi:MAG: xanthine dehydrogenase family protein molybdopterin-binding subunit [Polyangia bacterium]